MDRVRATGFEPARITWGWWAACQAYDPADPKSAASSNFATPALCVVSRVGGPGASRAKLDLPCTAAPLWARAPVPLTRRFFGVLPRRQIGISLRASRSSRPSGSSHERRRLYRQSGTRSASFESTLDGSQCPSPQRQGNGPQPSRMLPQGRQREYFRGTQAASAFPPAEPDSWTYRPPMQARCGLQESRRSYSVPRARPQLRLQCSPRLGSCRP